MLLLASPFKAMPLNLQAKPRRARCASLEIVILHFVLSELADQFTIPREEDARSPGVRTRLLRPILIASATLITSAAVSITGTVGWIGLIIRPIARLLVGPDFRRLLPESMLSGVSYLLVVDTLARTISPIEVPLGILTAAVVAPFFTWLLASERRGWE